MIDGARGGKAGDDPRKGRGRGTGQVKWAGKDPRQGGGRGQGERTGEDPSDVGGQGKT